MNEQPKLTNPDIMWKYRVTCLRSIAIGKVSEIIFMKMCLYHILYDEYKICAIFRSNRTEAALGKRAPKER